jgi:hypothetical protein
MLTREFFSHFWKWFEPIWLLFAKVSIENIKRKGIRKKEKKAVEKRFGPRPKLAHGLIPFPPELVPLSSFSPG